MDLPSGHSFTEGRASWLPDPGNGIPRAGGSLRRAAEKCQERCKATLTTAVRRRLRSKDRRPPGPVCRRRKNGMTLKRRGDVAGDSLGSVCQEPSGGLRAETLTEAY